jgi:hypothetical protein
MGHATWLRPALWLLAALVFAARVEKTPEPLFQTSDRCLACHNGLSTPSGQDVSIGFDWRPTMMANSSRDPYWQAAVRREIMDHPSAQAAIEGECAICHMPMARFESRRAGREGAIFALLPFDRDNAEDRLAADGVSCSLCHQIADQKLGSRESFVGRFVIDTERPLGQRHVYGRFKIEAGLSRIMKTSSGGFVPTESEHMRKSEVCATCHTLITHALGPKGEVIGELPEQVPYQEWLHSDYRETASCQTCHMPALKEETPIASVLGQPREGVGRHTFVGGNFFMLRMLNRFRHELAVEALPHEFDAAAVRTVAFLQNDTARLSIDRIETRAGRIEAEIAVENLAGHKLPTAYPSRRAWLHVVVRDGQRRVIFESGALDAQGLIQGNDNDLDARRFEPHYSEITSADQVQIYESIMLDSSGAVTTGLLSGVRYIKDNRLLPRGFDKRTADKEIAVAGNAAQDPDFTGGGDRIRYVVPLVGAQGPFEVEAELWYQPISYRWAANLRQYDAPEPRRFTRYYDSMAGASGLRLVRATAAAR